MREYLDQSFWNSRLGIVGYRCFCRLSSADCIRLASFLVSSYLLYLMACRPEFPILLRAVQSRVLQGLSIRDGTIRVGCGCAAAAHLLSTPLIRNKDSKHPLGALTSGFPHNPHNADQYMVAKVKLMMIRINITMLDEIWVPLSNVNGS